MTPQAQQALDSYLQIYPQLSSRKNELQDLFEQWDPQDSSPQISCRAGWIDLVLSCHKALKVLKPDYLLYSVKEKFGILHIYTNSYSGFTDLDNLYDPASLAFDAMLGHCEYMSQSICENCGITIREAGVTLRSFFGWVHTFCDQCELEYADHHIEQNKDKEYLKDTIEHWRAYRESIVVAQKRYQQILQASKE